MALTRMTLFTDASWCPTSKFGGWGAWARRDGWSRGYFFGGTFKTRFKSATLAEMGAVANALVWAGRENWLEGVDIVLVQSDSTGALVTIRDNIVGARENPHADGISMADHTSSIADDRTAAKVLDAIRSAVDLFDLSLEVRHVKGHAGGAHPRSAVNTQCDHIARKNMRLLRNGSGFGRERDKARS